MTWILGLSEDGSVVAGTSSIGKLGDAGFGSEEAFRWTEATGVVGLGFLSGVRDARTFRSAASRMNDDGSVIFGQSGFAGNPFSETFRWTAQSGMTGLGKPVDMLDVNLQSVSSNGAVLLGNVTKENPLQAVGVHWTAASGWTRLGALPGHTDSSAFRVSADGSLVLGWSGSNGVGEIFRWTESSGIQGLGNLSREPSCVPLGATRDLGVVVGECGAKIFRWTMAAGTTLVPTLPGYKLNWTPRVSLDGAVVVGQSEDDAGKNQVFRWTEATGTVGLGFLPGFEESSLFPGPYSLSADGKVVAGQLIHRDALGGLQAFRWTEPSGLMGLGFLPGDDMSEVYAVSADGSILAGASRLRGPNNGAAQGHAVMWDEKGTIHSIGAELEAAGVDLAGHRLSYAYVTIGNGQVILYGSAEGPEGRRGWVAWL